MDKCAILILGITGDLGKRKLIPALYHLLAVGQLDSCPIIGAALQDLTVVQVLEQARSYIDQFDPVIWQKLVDQFTYVPVNIAQPDDFQRLATVIAQKQSADSPKRLLVYCAVFESLYLPLTQALSQVGLLQKQAEEAQDWCRVVYEKPFGHNYSSVQALNNGILQYLNEHQIYRIDHYLAKEIVENIAFVRFTNRIFEPLWNHEHIDWVQIVLDEALDIEGRGGYYDRYGVIKDVVQNHILQLVALVGMEAPRALTGRAMCDAKAQVLKSIKCIDGVLGQYHGYLDENQVQSGSQTPTFAALRLEIDQPRWQGVPFYVKTGKVLGLKQTKICIKFKDTQLIAPLNQGVAANYLTISIYPKAGFDLQINAKQPQDSSSVVQVHLNSCYSSAFIPQVSRAYENVINDVRQGERTFAVRMDEIESSWAVSDQIEALGLPLFSYQSGSSGPQELLKWQSKWGFSWD